MTTTAPIELFTTDESLVLAEVFGPTVQGEGPSLGRAASFIRTGGCNLTCSWCTVPGMMILRPDFTWTPVEDLRVGDVVLGRTDPDKRRSSRSTATLRARRTRGPGCRVTVTPAWAGASSPAPRA
jgi:pyruvate-formate lyase-activating enzyme